MTIINAFHNDYVSTYMPEFIASVRLDSLRTANGKLYGAQSRSKRETLDDVREKKCMSQFPTTKQSS